MLPETMILQQQIPRKKINEAQLFKKTIKNNLIKNIYLHRIYFDFIIRRKKLEPRGFTYDCNYNI